MSNEISRNLILFSIHEYLRRQFGSESGNKSAVPMFLRTSDSYKRSSADLRARLRAEWADFKVCPYDKAVVLHLHGQQCSLTARVVRNHIKSLEDHDPAIFENVRSVCYEPGEEPPLAEKPAYTSLDNVTRSFYRSYIMDGVDMMLRCAFQRHWLPNSKDIVARALRIPLSEAAQLEDHEITGYIYKDGRISFDFAGRRVVIAVSVRPMDLDES